MPSNENTPAPDAARAAFEKVWQIGDLPLQLPYTGAKGLAWSIWQAALAAPREGEAPAAWGYAGKDGKVHPAVDREACERLVHALNENDSGVGVRLRPYRVVPLYAAPPAGAQDGLEQRGARQGNAQAGASDEAPVAKVESPHAAPSLAKAPPGGGEVEAVAISLFGVAHPNDSWELASRHARESARSVARWHLAALAAEREAAGKRVEDLDLLEQSTDWDNTDSIVSMCQRVCAKAARLGGAGR